MKRLRTAVCSSWFIVAGFIVSGLAVSVAGPVSGADLEMSGDDLPFCSRDQLGLWRKATAYSFGIAASSEPDGHWLGESRIEKQLASDHDQPIYVPYGPVKETLCGAVSRSDIEDSWSGRPLSTFVIPDNDYAHLLTIPWAVGAGSRADCTCESLIENCNAGTGNCLEVEVDPDPAFANNPWFFGGRLSPLVGRKMCTYGPWVADVGHALRPEIHPAEIYWWREQGGDETAAQLANVVMVQDVSGRFDRVEHEPWQLVSSANGDTADSDRVAWAAAPRLHRVSFAFEATTGSPSPKFDIHQHPGVRRGVVTADHAEVAADASDGHRHALTVDGTVVVEAEEMGAVSDALGVTFDGLCKSRDGSRIQGWVQLRAALDDGGFLGLSVAKYPVGTSAPEPSFPKLQEATGVNTRVVDGSLRFSEVSGTGESSRPEVLGTLAFRILPASDAAANSAPKKARVKKIELVPTVGPRQKLDFERSGGRQSLSGEISGVPMISPATLEFTLASGEIVRRELPGHVVSGWLAAAGVYNKESHERIWPAFARMARTEVEPMPEGLVGTKTVRVTVSPEWVPSRGDEHRREESTVVSAALGRALREGGAAAVELFGREMPVEVSWSYEARNLTKGVFVAVDESDEPPPEAIRVEPVDTGSPASAGVLLTFPAKSKRRLIEVIVTATVTDAFGQRIEIRKKIWNHAIGADPDDADAILRDLATRLEVSTRMITESSLEVTAERIDASTESRRVAARQARLRLLEAAADGHLDVEEFRGLLRLVAHYNDLMGARTRRR